MLNDNFYRPANRPDLNRTIYDDTQFSSCHIKFTNNILHPVRSYYIQSYKKLFRADNFNVNIRPDLLYFSIWGVYSKRYRNRNLWPVKTAKTLWTSSRRFFLMNCNTFYEDQCCNSCFDSEWTRTTECPSYACCMYLFLFCICIYKNCNSPLWKNTHFDFFECPFNLKPL